MPTTLDICKRLCVDKPATLNVHGKCEEAVRIGECGSLETVDFTIGLKLGS